MHLADDDLAPIRDLYARGLYRAAYERSLAHGPLTAWANTAARVLAGRLLMQLGAPRAGRLAHARAGRADPDQPEAAYYLARAVLEARGPYSCWRHVRRRGEFPDAPPEVRADWLSLAAFALGRLRDFDRAERYQQRAEALAPDSPWLAVERAALFEFLERPEDALAAARRSLELRPWFRPGVQAAAHVLQVLDRDAEAVELLTEADARLESSLVTAQLSAVQYELGRYADARRSLDRFAELTPLLEKKGREWLAGRRSDSAYFLGDRAAALDLAREAAGPPGAKPGQDGLPFFKHLVEHLAAAPADARAGRVELPPLPKRPEDGGPSPAVLAGLAKFWGRDLAPPADLAGSDGLPDHRERATAEAAGLVAREFTVTTDAVAGLIDRGVPFALAAVESGYANVVAVVGYDLARGSLFFRDASSRAVQEAVLGAFLDRYKPSGPRGLAVVPADKSSLLDGVELPDAARYDRLHRLQAALAAHDRPAAQAEAEALAAEDAGHRIALLARLALARYDASPLDMLAALDGLLANAPNDFTFQLARSACLRDLGRRDERLALLRRMTGLPEGPAVFGPHLAQALAMTPREAGRAAWMLRRTVRRRPLLAAGYVLLGNLTWDDGRFDEALDLYRFAASLDERDEVLTQTYTRAARARGQTPDALRFLQTRVQRLGQKSTLPARMLASTLLDLDQPGDMFSALGRALHLHPTEGELLLFAARQRAAFGEDAEADDLLARAKGRASDSSWRRAAADIALQRAKPLEALTAIRPLAEAEPLDVDLQRMVVRLTAEAEGRPAAVEHLRRLGTRFPRHVGLAHLWAEQLRGEPPSGAEPVLRGLVAAFPDDPWLRREAALHLADLGRYDEALAELDAARRLEPISPSTAAVTGRVYSLAGRTADARAAYREAVRQSVDTEVAIAELVSLAPDEDSRKAELAFVAGELARQAHAGDAVFAYRNQAVTVLDPEELLEQLQELHDDQPRLWQAWTALVNQHGMTGQLEMALNLATEATEQFPLVPQVWTDLAHVHQAREEKEDAAEALRGALKAAPGWGPAARELSEMLEQTDEAPAARELLRLAVARQPLDPANHGYLADALWRADEPKAAVERLEHAIRLDPGYEWAWRTLAEWAERSDQRARVAALARDVTARRPGDARAWLALVRALPGAEHADEVLAALDRAIALDPRQVEAYDLKGERLAEAGRFEEALAACRAAAGVATDPPRPKTPPAPARDEDDDEEDEEDAGPSEELPPPRREGVPLPADAPPESDLPFILQGRLAWIEAKRGNYAAAIPPMQALVAVEPGYYWGWQQLADWYNETSRPAAYLEAASELVRLRPDSPVALARRGEARLQTGDREGGKADLRQSQQLAPDYAFSGMALFDAHLADGEVADAARALAILQEHVGDDTVLARQVQLLSKQGDREHAAEVLKEIASNGSPSAYGQYWPLQASVNAMREAGWDEDADTTLLGVTYDRTFHPLAALIWNDGPAGLAAPLGDKVAILERAAAAHPHYLPAHDGKAELLARHGRFDEAAAACRPAALGDPPPVLLRGRAAWVTAQRGDRAGAIAQMRVVVAGEPDYHWGWRQLAQWCDQSGDAEGYREASDQLVRLAPRDPEAFGYRAEAKLQAGDRAGAKADFRKAYSLDPRYSFAGLNLFDAQLQDGDLDDAAETLNQLKANGDGPLVRLRAVRLAVKREDAAAAEGLFRELCTDAAATPFVITRAADEMQSGGQAALADRVLEETLPDPAAGPAVGRAWVERALAAGRWEALDRLDGLLARGEIGRQALNAAAEGLGRPDRLDRLRELVARHADALREETGSWARAGAALARAGADKDAADWMAGWAEREDVEPWMLLDFSLALRRLGRPAEALDVNRHALDLSDDEDDARDQHAAWVGLEEALAGRAAEAGPLLEADPSGFDPPHRYAAELGRAVLTALRARSHDRDRAFAAARRMLAEAAKAHAAAASDPALAGLHDRAVKRVAASAGGLWAWVWGLFNRRG